MICPICKEYHLVNCYVSDPKTKALLGMKMITVESNLENYHNFAKSLYKLAFPVVKYPFTI